LEAGVVVSVKSVPPRGPVSESGVSDLVSTGLDLGSGLVSGLGSVFG
jgi:hypothetical protein